ncbi:MAG: hypothetical protein ACPIOQ_16630, partial [Promethearchaeia archaeon]
MQVLQVVARELTARRRALANSRLPNCQQTGKHQQGTRAYPRATLTNLHWQACSPHYRPAPMMES